jgi:hypothetical protein
MSATTEPTAVETAAAKVAAAATTKSTAMEAASASSTAAASHRLTHCGKQNHTN